MIRALIALLLISVGACAQTRMLIGTRDTGTVAVDNIAPNPPSSFQVTAYNDDSISVSWIAPGDDGAAGTATNYRLGYSTSRISTGEMISNPAMATSIAGWITLQGSEAISWSSTGHNAAGSLRMIHTGNPYEGSLFPVNSTASGSIYISAYVYYDGPLSETNLDFYILDQNNGIIGSFGPTTVPRGSWTALSRTITATGLQTQIRLGVQFDPGTVADVLYIDDVSMTTGVAFSSTMEATGVPAPLVAGTTQNYTLSSLTPATLYYMAMTATDDKGNVSGLSNVISQLTLGAGDEPEDEDVILAVQTGYYVSTTGDAGNSGKDSLNKWTMAKALTDAGSELATGYDTVLVDPGIYDVALSPTRPGLFNQRIVWKKRGYGEVIIRGVAGGYETMSLTQPYHTFDGFTIKNQDPNDVPIAEAPGYNSYYMVNGSTDYIIFKRCRFPLEVNVPTYSWGASERRYRAMVIGGKHWMVEKCFFRGWNMGIVETGSSPRYNTVRRDTFYAHFSSPINLQTTTDGSTNFHGTLIDSCVIDTSLQEDGIQFEDYQDDPGNTALHRGVIIRDNYIARCAENAIDMKTSSYVWIEGNLIHGSEGNDDGGFGTADNTGSGPPIERHNVDPGTDHITLRYNVLWDNLRGFTTTSVFQAFNNTLLNNRRTYAGPNQTAYQWYNMNPWSPTGPVEVFNNIFASISGTSTSAFVLVGSSPSIFSMNNNAYYDSSGSAQWGVSSGGPGVFIYYQTLLTWQTATGYDLNSLYANPLFTNTPLHPYDYNAAWDFTLGPTSTLVDKGRPHAYTVSAANSSTTVLVTNPFVFRSNMGNPNITGDMISIDGGTAVEVTAVDYTNGVLTLAAPRSWTSGKLVILTRYVDDGLPDIGAKER
jgi:hypothetical protein